MSLEELYDTQVDKVYKYFYIQCLNRHVSEDLTSQTFMMYLDKSRVLHINEPKKYLYAIMRNIWLEYLRDKYKTITSTVEDIENFEVHVTNEVDEYNNGDVRARIQKFILRLPEAQKKVVILRHHNGMVNKEVAEELGKDINYVKVTYRRALSSLRQMIQDPSLLSIQEGETYD